MNTVALIGQLVSPPDPADRGLVLRLAVARSRRPYIEPGVHLIDVLVLGRLGREAEELEQGQYIGVTAHIEREPVEGEPTTEIVADELHPPVTLRSHQVSSLREQIRRVRVQALA